MTGISITHLLPEPPGVEGHTDHKDAAHPGKDMAGAPSMEGTASLLLQAEYWTGEHLPEAERE